MKQNVGGFDKIARIIVGIALIAFALYTNQFIAYIGIIPLITGLIGFCPLYTLFGYSSAKKEK
jgi:hypothetical protein